MSFNFVFKHRCFFPFFLLIALISPTGFAANLALDCQIGFNGLFRLHKWVPIAVTLENKGPDIRTVLEVVVMSGSEFWRDVQSTVYSEDVDLPEHSRKLRVLSVRIDTFVHPLVIRLRQGDRVLLSKSLNLRSSYTEKRLVLMPGQGVSREFPALLPEEYMPVAGEPEFLPESPLGYDGVDLVIMPVTVLKRLREKQFIALQGWLERGGYLVTAGDLNDGIFREENIRALLGAVIEGFEKLTGLPGLNVFCGRGLMQAEPFLVLKAKMPDAAVLLTEKGLPIIFQKEIGLGRIIFTTFDHQSLPFTSWPGQKLFWQKILTLKPFGAPEAIALDRQILQHSMISAMPLGFPGVWTVILFSVFYLGGMKIITRQAAKEKIKAPWALICAPSLCVICAVMAGAFFYIQRGERCLSVNHFQHLYQYDSRAYAAGFSLTGIYSTCDTTYRFSRGLKAYAMTPILPAKPDVQVPVGVEFLDSAKGQVVIVRPEKWSFRFIAAQMMTPFPLSGKAWMEGRDLIITWVNSGPHAVQNGCFYFSKRLFFVETIAPGQTLTRRFLAKEISEQEMYSSVQAEHLSRDLASRTANRFFGTMKKAVIPGFLEALQARASEQPEVLYFCGWIEQSSSPLTLEEPVMNGEDLTLLEWRLPVRGGS